MIALNLSTGDPQQRLRILCLGAHSDDIEIGCGGALLHLRQRFAEVEICWVVFSATGTRAREAQKGAALFSDNRRTEVILKEFRDGFLPCHAAAVKEFFEELKGQTDPDVIFTHSRSDAHQDHRLISELTWNTFRNHLILEYEIPKYDGDMGRPSLFVPLPAETCQRKVSNIMEAFCSQHGKRWFEPETFLALMRLRGMECNSPSGYAEAFYCHKVTLC